MTAPTRALRQRIKPLCRVCLRSSCTARLAWPAVCRGGRPAAPAAQFTSGLADVRAGRMLSDAQVGLIARRNAQMVASFQGDYASLARTFQLSEQQVRAIVGEWQAANSQAAVEPAAPAPDANAGAGGGGDLSADLAQRALPIPLTVAPEHDLLSADIEARLTQEMDGLVNALSQFARRAQAIGEELPPGRHLDKAVTLLFSLVGFQLANAFMRDTKGFGLLSCCPEYMEQLHLKLSDAVREVRFDGRRFLAVALVDQQAGQLFGAGKA